MVQISVLYRHGNGYEEFNGAEVTHSSNGNLITV